ncbi:MAG TPA: ATP-binding protein [Jiangellales bacterium]|nr:ATP-binding protein [Jiangellales bacterium]
MSGSVDAVVDLPASPRSVPGARRFARRAAQSAGLDPDTTDLLLLVVSELVTNAVVHAATSVRVHLLVGPDDVRVEVCDQADLQPVLRTHSRSATTGRGLRMLATLTDSWGVEDVAEGGKMVWASFPVGSPASDDELAERYGDVTWLLEETSGAEGRVP